MLDSLHFFVPFVRKPEWFRKLL